MRNLNGTPITVQGERWRASTGYVWGRTTYQSHVQTEIDRDQWDSGKSCQHAHRSAEAALDCGERRLSRKVDRWMGLNG